MWLDGCLLGAGHASTLVALAVQKLRLPWTLILEDGNMARKLQEEWIKKKPKT
jgi:hypothetical protein